MVCITGAALAGLALAVGIVTAPDTVEEDEQDESHSSSHFVNWSNTHEVTTKCLHEPETLQDLQNIVELAHLRGKEVGASLLNSSCKFATSWRLKVSTIAHQLLTDAIRVPGFNTCVIEN